MNVKSKIVSIFGAGIIALSMVGGVAAQAPSKSVDVNVQVNKGGSGTLSYSLSAGDFNAVNTSLSADAKSQGTLTLTVLDERFTREGWVITMNATDFTSGNKPSFAASALTVKPQGVVQKVQGDPDLPVASEATMGNGGKVVLTAPKTKGSGEYRATYDGAVTVPANTQEGVYKTTISVSAGSAP